MALKFFVPVILLVAVVSAQTFNPVIPESVALDLLSNLDPATSPCDDFFQYACGGWINRTVMPSTDSRFDRSFNNIDDHNQELVLSILNNAATNPGNDTLKAKIGNFFAGCMDTATIDSRGIRPLDKIFGMIHSISSLDSIMELIGHLLPIGVSTPFSFGVEGDPKGPAPVINMGDFGQSGLGLFDRDYYLTTTPEGLKLLSQYQTHIANMLVLAGETSQQAAADAADIVHFETGLAKVQLDSVIMRDPNVVYNKIGLNGLKALAPHLNWALLLNTLGFPTNQSANINVEVPDYFKALGVIMDTTKRSVLQAYFKWQVLHAFASHLSAPFVNESFAFYGQIVQGVGALKPRDRRCSAYTDQALGFITGTFFVEKAFPGASQVIVSALIGDIEAAFGAGLPSVDWMTNTTRTAANQKLNAVVNNVGAPAKIPDYSSVIVSRSKHFENVVQALIRTFHASLAKVGKALDKHEWQMTPPTVNAYYDPTTNTINFPAGILQTPFFDVSYPAPMNFGGIGMVMGHELTHGFDDQGAQYDGNGRLVKWWDQQSIDAFKGRTQCIANQYSKYEPIPGVFINGNLTLGENIADNGGIKEAFRSWKTWESAQPAPLPRYMEKYSATITNDQLFYLSYAQSWCEIAKPEYVRYQVKNDVHSPAKFRVIGPLSNQPEFATAFGCPANSRMNPTDKCKLW